HYNLPVIDAWFLDGFSPTKNSLMWSDNLFDNISKLCHNHSSFATFTASSKVRKASQNFFKTIIHFSKYFFKVSLNLFNRI
ncbi:MnmC family methyltransferase, partial [Francisella tularensis]|uniref:MnmC family methyltransferase n=1 Tax=Francisella tularensis TaxID=263 RepID=UPI000516ED08